MAVFLSPGVFLREIVLPALSNTTSPLRPAFIGTAKKGPFNQALLLTTPQQALDTYGDPFPTSYLMYAVLAFLEEGNACFVMRVGVECEDGQAAEIAAICVDTSGGHGDGWGKIPLFTGIDFGRINLAIVNTTNQLSFHAASVSATTYNEATASTTQGPTTATLNITGIYTGAIDDSFIMIITGAPTVSAADRLNGAAFEVVRNSDGQTIASGTLVDFHWNGQSQVISLGNGLNIQVVVTAGVLGVNDTFSFSAHPDNRSFSVSVDGGAATTYQMLTANYTTLASFVTAFNLLIPGEKYLMIQYTLADGITLIPQLRTTVAGNRIQIMGSPAWALQVGTQQYAWDIPRSYLLGLDSGPFDITTQNNRIAMNLIGNSTTQTVEFNIPTGLAQTAASVAASIAVAGVVAGSTLWKSFALNVPNGSPLVVIVADVSTQFDTLQLLANYSNLKTLRFAEQLNIPYPYKRAYRGYTDNRLTLPDSGESSASTPLSCEVNPLSSSCAADTAYFTNIVGWLVAPSAGTWTVGYTATLQVATDGIFAGAGNYNLTIKDSTGLTLDFIQNINFDKTTDRYIANVINPGSKFGGTTGSLFVNWDERPAFLNNDPANDPADYAVRFPSQFLNMVFAGQADGIPTDPTFSNLLDMAVIGIPSTNTGLFAFQNPEGVDVNIIATPGFSSGAVIGTALQVCESRGDVLYIVDPPFGLRPQQVVDWHNGMLFSDLSSAINSSYGALYWSWVQVFDQFSGQNIWIPPSGHVTAVFSRTARVAEQWFAPAGLNRGHLLTALDVEYSPTQGERDLLYGSGNAVQL